MTSTSKAGHRQYGTLPTKLHDPYAQGWVEKVATRMEEKVIKPYVEEHGDPEDWMDLCIHKVGNLGISSSMWAERLEDGRIVYKMTISVDKHKFDRWVRENLYLFEGFITFRLGPVIVAHPGREQTGRKVGNTVKQMSIKPWDAEFGLLGEDDTEWFNLFQGSIMLSAVRGKSGEWEVERVK